MGAVAELRKGYQGHTPTSGKGLPCADHSVRVLRLRCRLTHLCIPVPRSEPASPHRPSLQRLQGLKPGPATWLPCSVPRDEQRESKAQSLKPSLEYARTGQAFSGQGQQPSSRGNK
ncbi:Receptor-interacting serine/threonine-protein kinase 1 [Manis javanica]|nr:Receptor-interacting serine/threonine-protein kinase 1 [Manis javanica]